MSSTEKQPLVSSKDLPMPRLELRWDHDGTPSGWGEFRRSCRYLLVMPVFSGDVRKGSFAANEDGTALEFEFGATDCSGGQDQRVWLEQQRVDMPYRDGSHAAWDAHLLRLPAYATCGEHAMFIEPRDGSK